MKLKGISKRLTLRDLKTLAGMMRVYKNWREILSDSFGISSKPEMTVVLRNGVRFVARDYTTLKDVSSTKLVGNEIWIREAYNPPGFEIKKGDVVVDIGAHIGAFSLYAAYHGGKGSKVYSYEPSPLAFDMLKKNIRLNRFEKIITPFRLAVWSKKGKRNIYMSNADSQGQGTMLSDSNFNIPVVVNCITLSDIVKSIVRMHGRIDFLKCDCEGAEYDIFLSTPKKYLEKIEKISLEYHGYSKKHSKDDLKLFFENMGFEVSIKPEFETLGMMYVKIK